MSDAQNQEQPRKQLRLGIFGFGEIGHGIALGLHQEGLASIVAFQRHSEKALTQQRAREANVRLVESPAELAKASDIIIAVTQGSQSVSAATAIAPALNASHCYVDLASATPKIKLDVAAALAASKALYADGAIEGSPLEHGHRFPIIVSGPAAQTFADALNPWGMRIAVMSDKIGHCAAIKGLRHILMKGQIALLLECAVAAKHYGISDELFTSVAEWYDALPFMTNSSRLLRTTTVHAERRKEEAAMAQSILEDMGLDPIMTRSTVAVLAKVERLGLREKLGGVPPTTFDQAIELMQDYQRTS